MTRTASEAFTRLVDRLARLDAGAEPDDPLAVALAEHGADSVLSYLRDEAERQRQIDTQRSLRLAQAVIRGADLAGRADHRALGAMATADAQWLVGQYASAADNYEAARASFLDQQHTVGWARSYIGWVIVQYYLGRGEAALAELAPVQQALQSHEEWVRAAALDMNAGYVCWRMGRYAEALERYERAEQTFQSKVPASELKVAWLRGNQALVLAEMGEFDRSLKLHAAARPVFEQCGDSISVLRTDIFVADIYQARGDFAQALDLYQVTAVALEEAALDADLAWVALSMAGCYLGLNRYGEAVRLAADAADRFTQLGSPSEVARARYYQAMACVRQGHITDARAFLDEAASGVARTGQAALDAAIAVQRATLASADDDWPAAVAAAAHARERGLASRRAVLEIEAAYLEAQALFALGDSEAAVALAQTTLASAQARGVPTIAHQAEHLLGRITAARGDLPAAMSYFERAMTTIDQLQARLATDLRLQFLDDKLQVYRDAIDCALGQGQAEHALACLERAKSRAVSDFLARHAIDERRYAADPTTRRWLDEQRRLRQEHAWLYRRLHLDDISRRPPASMPADVDDGDPQSLAGAIDARERRIAALADRLATRHIVRQREQRDEPAIPLTVPTLDHDAIIVEYYVRDADAVAFVIAEGAVQTVSLATTDAAIRRWLQLWQLSLEAAVHALAGGTPPTRAAANMRSLLTTLSSALMAPLAPHLAGRRHLIVIPHGSLHAVPFHALADEAGYLVQRVTMTVCPSLRLLGLLSDRPRRDGRSLVLGHSAAGRLPGAVAEAQAVARLLDADLLLEEQATCAALATAGGGRAIVHVAAHGEARLDNPAFAHIALDDEHLTTADVVHLDLDGALVVLSACESGRGLVAAGDEVVSLSRGFLFAGASAIVQSLWRVDDEATASLFTHFYRALAAGETPAAALRQSQMALIDAGGQRSLPFYWAAFQAVGAATSPRLGSSAPARPAGRGPRRSMTSRRRARGGSNTAPG